MTTQATAVDLPPLPKFVGHLHSTSEFCLDRQVPSDIWPVELFTADQMRAYASACALASLAAKDAEVVMLREAIDVAIAYLVPRLSHQTDSHGAIFVLPKLLKAITQGAQS